MSLKNSLKLSQKKKIRNQVGGFNFLKNFFKNKSLKKSLKKNLQKSLKKSLQKSLKKKSLQKKPSKSEKVIVFVDDWEIAKVKNQINKKTGRLFKDVLQNIKMGDMIRISNKEGKFWAIVVRIKDDSQVPIIAMIPHFAHVPGTQIYNYPDFIGVHQKNIYGIIGSSKHIELLNPDDYSLNIEYIWCGPKSIKNRPALPEDSKWKDVNPDWEIGAQIGRFMAVCITQKVALSEQINDELMLVLSPMFKLSLKNLYDKYFSKLVGIGDYWDFIRFGEM